MDEYERRQRKSEVRKECERKAHVGLVGSVDTPLLLAKLSEKDNSRSVNKLLRFRAVVKVIDHIANLTH